MELDRVLKEKREEILRIAVRHGVRNLPAARAARPGEWDADARRSGLNEDKRRPAISLAV